MNRLGIEKMSVKNRIWSFLRKCCPILLVSFFLISSCYVPPSGTPISGPETLPPAGAIKLTPAAVKPLPAQAYFYPKKGQSPEQQDRDRYECYNWAVQQTGFDPVNLPPSFRAAVVPVMGGAAGAAPDTAGQDQAKQIGRAYSSQDQMLYDQFEKKGMDFRRAMSACLEGRGYSGR